MVLEDDILLGARRRQKFDMLLVRLVEPEFLGTDFVVGKVGTREIAAVAAGLDMCCKTSLSIV